MSDPVLHVHLPQAGAPKAIGLQDLPIGQCGAICHVDAADDDVQRLMTMGVCLGRKVQLIQSGDPMILRVMGARVGVSRRLAEAVKVEMCGDPACATDAGH